MNKKDLLEKIRWVEWWHSIELPTDEGDIITTPGRVDHCSENSATTRFGMPENLLGKTILDVGAWDGYFSFLAEKRGATVTAIDPYQNCSNTINNSTGFEVAKEALNSAVTFYNKDLHDYEKYINTNKNQFNIILYYGVLYHIDNPIKELKTLFDLCIESVLIETAISPEIEINGERQPIWQFRNGFNGDFTNKWYPNITGLVDTLKYVGFRQGELIYNDGNRITVRATK